MLLHTVTLGWRVRPTAKQAHKTRIWSRTCAVPSSLTVTTSWPLGEMTTCAHPAEDMYLMGAATPETTKWQLRCGGGEHPRHGPQAWAATVHLDGQGTQRSRSPKVQVGKFGPLGSISHTCPFHRSAPHMAPAVDPHPAPPHQPSATPSRKQRARHGQEEETPASGAATALHQTRKRTLRTPAV